MSACLLMTNEQVQANLHPYTLPHHARTLLQCDHDEKLGVIMSRVFLAASMKARMVSTEWSGLKKGVMLRSALFKISGLCDAT